MSGYAGQTARDNAQQHNGDIYNNYHVIPQPQQPHQESKQADLNNKVLAAAHNGQLHRIKHLLARGADIDHYSDTASPCPNISQGYTALHLAARRGHTAVVGALILSGADVHACNTNPCDYRTTALYEACQVRSIPMMEVLLDAGADVNQKLRRGMTCLHFVFWRSVDEKVAERLLRAGADWRTRDDKRKTPLDLARNCNLTGVYEFLRKYGPP